MEEIVKHINDTNASYRTPNAGDAKNTDLFLDNEHYQLFSDSGEQITVRFSKENLTKAILFIASILPRKYDNSSIHKEVPFSKKFVLEQLESLDGYFVVDGISVDHKTQIWNARKDVLQKNGKIDNRFYFNGLLEDFSYNDSNGILQKSKFTIRNYLAGGYSDIHIRKGEDGIFDVWITNVLEPYDDGKESDIYVTQEYDYKKQPLQRIYYGAPGTGKSHEIKEQTEGKQVIRTTFHPDSDYSTFVGAYKPTTIEVPMRDVTGKVIVENGQPVTENRIVYEFVEQAFLQAYIKAWKQYAKAAAEGKEAEEVFLVIEEINRGNCAQIFGDLFQLLDRGDDGFSEYPINADKDLQRQLAKAFEKMEYLKAPALCGMTAEEVAVKVRKGEILLLPNNLYIWATMNTSDQSLFPIDSAFKRRWDWVYMPITDAKKNYVIEIDNDQYDWWSFLTVINAIIESTTRSEDKKLGYFFAKAKDNKITADTFVGKIIFYLWNDVFKDNETNHKAFKDEDGDMLAFHKFFHDDGSVNTNVVIKFLQDLEVYPFELPDDGTAAQSVTIPNAKRQRDKSRYSVNGTDGLNKAQMTREAFRLYIDAHPEADAQEIAQVWNGLGLKDYVRHLVETEEDFNTRTKDSSDPNKRATEFELSNGEKIYLSTQFGIGNIGRFIDAVNNAGWNIRIDKQA